jgi:hypothetical protein
MMGTAPGAMRSMLAVLLAVAPAAAETPRPGPDTTPDAKAPAPDAKAPAPDAKAPVAPKGAPRTLPPASLQDVMPRTDKPSGNGTGGLSFGGGFSLGSVIVPAPHPDGQPWPRGMVITPPDVGDPMAIAPGGDGLTPGERREPPTWGQRLADAVHGGIGALFGLVLPAQSL